MNVFIGTDSGATTSKTGGVWADGSVISTELAQSNTCAADGTEAVIQGWVAGAKKFLQRNQLSWGQVMGFGLALPGPYLQYGILGPSANLPKNFAGWNFYEDYKQALQKEAGREISLVVGNDGRYGGIAEARALRTTPHDRSTVLMLAPGSGLGCSFIKEDGLPLEGDMLSGTELAHTPAPLHLLNIPALRCGCGRDWGCYEAYTSISGLTQLLDIYLPKHPGHILEQQENTKTSCLALRDLAQEGDALALDIFNCQARAVGYLVATMARVFDPTHIVIGGGLMDPASTTKVFREQYLHVLWETAKPYLDTPQRANIQVHPASLGELSQAIGAALMALLKNTE